MSTKKTENLGLHAWERTDAFSMDEFNENFNKLDTAVGAKAEKTVLDTLAGQVAKKAEQSALDTLSGKVAKKAEQSALDTLSGKVDKKAEQTALDAETAAREALAGKVDKKAEQSALDAEAAARKSADDTKAPIASPTFTGTPKAPTASSTSNSTQIATTAFVKTAVNALAGRVGTLESEAVRFEIIQYNGTGSSTVTHTFSFPPKLIIIWDVSFSGGILCMNRNQDKALRSKYNSTSNAAHLTWEGNTVTLTADRYANNQTESICNDSGLTYYGFAIG